jgi:multiple antibiotic resistance protein
MTEKLLKDFILFFATLDPIGTLVIFAMLTTTADAAERRRLAWKSTLYAGVILIGAIVLGQIVLSAMGIQLRSLELAGGVILFLFGLKMTFGGLNFVDKTEGEQGHDLAVFPLAIPSIASPGAITAAIILTDNKTHAIPAQAMTGAMLVIVLLISYLLMRISHRVLDVLGRNGAAIVVRMTGMILAALSIEMVMGALAIPGWASAPF